MPPSLEAYDAWLKDPTNPHKDNVFERYMTRKAIRMTGNLNGYRDEFMDTVPKAMFVLLPIFALLLKGIYYRSRRYYVEHLVFALHAHAFLFALLTIMQIPILHPINPILFLWIPLYLFLAMRRVYEQGFFKTLLKMSILGVCYLILLVLLVLLTGFVVLVSL
jgi:hypothetical protein